MTAAGGRLPLLALLIVFLGVAVGPACRRAPPVATALEVAGTAERATAEAWSPVVPGTPFAIGDTLRTGAASRARLALAGGGVIRVGERARLRFQRGAVVGQQAPDVAVELGSAEVDETVSEMSIVTAVGPARIDRGTHLRVRTDGQSASLEVVVGRAVMLDAGQEVAIDAGHGVRIRLGSPEIERFALTVGEAVVEEQRPRADGAAPTAAEIPDGGPSAAEAAAAKLLPADAAVAAAPTPSEGAAARADEATSRSQRTETGRADITLTAGESATVHDGRPPAAVRLRTDGLCSGEAIVELGGHGHHRERLVGARAVVVRLQPGVRPYRVRCASDTSRAEPRASGVLSLRRDTGNVALARRAPADVIEADGRHYTVLFQTRLPRLTLAWPAAPPAARLELHLESAAGERVLDSESAQRPLPAGTVQEGTYTFWYRAPDGKHSAKTTVSIRFDNTAPTAQFFRAAHRAEKGPPGAIAIDGVTVEGATVSVGGQPIAVDGHGRFRTEAAPLAGDEAVAVRLEHPRTGVHYYVRRRGAAR